MLNSEYLVDASYAVIFLLALIVVVHDVWSGFRVREPANARESAQPVRWRTGVAIIILAWLPIFIAVLSGGF